MTSFGTLEASRESSEPVEIYRITLGSTTYRYTSASADVIIGLETFAASAISRSNVVATRERNSDNFVITLPSSDPFPRNYLNIAPGVRANVTVFRLQLRESPSFATQALLFEGVVQQVAFSDDGYFAQIQCRSIENSRAENIPRYTFMGPCNHFLYDSQCGVNPGLFDTVSTVSAGGTTNVLTVPGAAAQADGYFDGGYLTPTTGQADFRMILSHTGDQITILLPFAVDVTNLNVQLFAGCDHTLSGDCALKFDNVENYGGSFFVPNKNIFTTGLSGF